jgi:hypothetical protein
MLIIPCFWRDQILAILKINAFFETKCEQLKTVMFPVLLFDMHAKEHIRI